MRQQRTMWSKLSLYRLRRSNGRTRWEGKDASFSAEINTVFAGEFRTVCKLYKLIFLYSTPLSFFFSVIVAGYVWDERAWNASENFRSKCFVEMFWNVCNVFSWGRDLNFYRCRWNSGNAWDCAWKTGCLTPKNLYFCYSVEVKWCSRIRSRVWLLYCCPGFCLRFGFLSELSLLEKLRMKCEHASKSMSFLA